MQCKAGKRPRFSIVKSIINVYDIKPFYVGNINEIEKDYNNVFHNNEIYKKDKKPQIFSNTHKFFDSEGRIIIDDYPIILLEMNFYCLDEENYYSEKTWGDVAQDPNQEKK